MFRMAKICAMSDELSLSSYASLTLGPDSEQYLLGQGVLTLPRIVKKCILYIPIIIYKHSYISNSLIFKFLIVKVISLKKATSRCASAA